MKKLAFCALVAALVVALAAPAICETKIGGSYRIRGVYWDQGLDEGKFLVEGEGGERVPGVGRYFDNRLRLNIDAEVSDTVAVHVEADSGLGYNGRNGDFQNPAATPDSYDGLWNRGGSFINMPEPGAADRDVWRGSVGMDNSGHDIVFQQAYMDFATPIGAFSLGRQWSFWGMGLLVGENRNRLAWSYQIPEFQIGAGYDKFFEGEDVLGAFTRSDDQDNYFLWGMYEGPNYQFGPYFEYTHADRINPMITDQLPLLGHTISVGELRSVSTYGVSIYGSIQLGDLSLMGEFAYRGGTADTPDLPINEIDFNSYAGAGRATYELPMCTVGGEAGYMSGQEFSETDELGAFLTPWSFSPFAILGEFAINGLDLLGRPSRVPGQFGTTDPGSYSDFCSNMIYGKAFVQASPIPKLDAYLGVGYAISAEDRVVLGGPNSGDERSELGTEIDISLTYAITPNLTYNFTGGYLFVGNFFDDANYAWVEGFTAEWDGIGTPNAEDAMLAVHSITVHW